MPEVTTSRMALPKTKNILLLIEKMTENCLPVSDILIDLLYLGEEKASAILDALDDMNIRGEQILPAYDYADTKMGRSKMGKFYGLVIHRDKGLVDYVNENYDHADTEWAVTSGAKEAYAPYQPKIK